MSRPRLECRRPDVFLKLEAEIASQNSVTRRVKSSKVPGTKTRQGDKSPAEQENLGQAKVTQPMGVLRHLGKTQLPRNVARISAITWSSGEDSMEKVDIVLSS